MPVAGIFKRHVEALVVDLGLNPAQSLARLLALTTSMYRSSAIRYTNKSSTMPPRPWACSCIGLCRRTGRWRRCWRPTGPRPKRPVQTQKLAHVAHVKHADVVAHSVVLFLQPSVLHRHAEPGKGTILPPPQGARRGGGEFKWGCLHGAKVMRRLPARGGRPRRGWTALQQSPACLQTLGDRARWRRRANAL